MFEPDALNPWLDDPRLRAAVTTAGTVTSTNVILKKSVQNGGPLPQILIADQQTAGVGRHGKHFASPADAGLYISYAFHPQINRALITPAAGVALQQAIADQFGISTQIKWVNDLQKAGKKVAGILAEPLLEQNAVILGTGVDLFPAASGPLPNDQPMTTILREVPANDPRPELAGRYLTHLMRLFANPETIMPAYRKRAAWVGRRITVSGTQNPLTGTISGFDDNGALLLKTDLGTLVVSSGTIRLVETV